MRVAHLHRLFTPNCLECGRPLVKASVLLGGGEETRELDKALAGIACLSCGTQYDSLTPLHAVRHVVPFEWSAIDSACDDRTSISGSALCLSLANADRGWPTPRYPTF